MTRCSEACKVKKMQLEGENNKLRRELMMSDETKQNLEKQNRLYEHEVKTYHVSRIITNRFFH